MLTQKRADQLRTSETAPELHDSPDQEAEPGDAPLPQSTADLDDTSWAQDIADYREGLHGVELKELLAALANGTLPEALLDKLSVELVDGDRRWKASINDARNGAMMRAKFQQLTAAQAQREKDWNGEREEFFEYLRGWKSDPDLLLAGMERLGLPFDQAARKYSARLDEINQLWALEQQKQVPAGTTKKLWEQQQLERELTELKTQQTREQSRQQQYQEARQTEQAVQVIQDAGAQALRSVGMDPTDETVWKIFRRHLTDHYGRTQQMPNRQDVLDAASSAKEEIAQYISDFEARKAKPAPGLPRNSDPAAPDMTNTRPRGSAPKSVSTKEWTRKNLYGLRTQR